MDVYDNSINWNEIFDPNEHINKDSGFKYEYCEKLVKHMASGLSFTTFAATILVTRRCMYHWEKKSKNFAHAKKLGFALCQLWWERAGIDNLDNKSFNANIWRINMHMRFRKEWSPAEQKINIEAKIRGDVGKLPAMSDEEVIKIGKEAIKYLEAEYEDKSDEEEEV